MGLRAARVVGNGLNSGGVVSRQLLDLVQDLQGQRDNWQSIRFDKIRELYTLLDAELRTKSADLIVELDKLQVEFKGLVDYGAERMEGRYARLLADRRLRYPQDLADMGPTRMANLSEIHRDYGIQHYGLDIEFFWLRLLKVIKNDADFYPILEVTKNQLDYSVTVTVLISMSTAAWVVLSYLFCPSVIPFMGVCAIGGFLAWVFYSITVQNYRAFAEAVRSAMDLHRFDLLKALHIGLPADSVAEKSLWEQIYLWQDDNKIIFNHNPGA